jgi:membrane associated rhomboid family serine protease
LISYEGILDRLAGGARATLTPDAPVPSWRPEPPEELGEKPAEGAYGYLVGDKRQVSTAEGVAERLAESPGIPAVWTPETAALTRPEDVPSLHAAVHQRMRRALRKAAVGAGVVAAVMAAVVVGLWLVWDVGLGSLFAVIGMIAVVEMLQALGSLHGLRTFDPGIFPRARQAGRHAVWLMARPAPHTQWLAGWLVAVAAVGIVVDDRALAVAGLVKDRVWAEPFRLVTAALLHVHFFHAWMNVPALLWLGRLVEAHTPRARVALVFLVSALGGTLLSAAIDPRTSVGASGGILGLVGYLVVMAHRRPGELPDGFGRVLRSAVAATAALGVLGISFIDNAAHLGGFAAGMALGRAMSSYDEGDEPRWLRAAGWAALGVVTAAALATLLLVFFDPLGSAAARGR